MPQMLLPLFPTDVTIINGILSFARRGDTVYYFHGPMPVFSHAIKDLKSFRLITAQFVVNGNATQAEIVRAFGISTISMKRYVKLYREEGVEGFFKPRRPRSATVLTRERLREIQKLLDEGINLSLLAEQLDLKMDTIRKAVRDGRLHRVEKKSMR